MPFEEKTYRASAGTAFVSQADYLSDGSLPNPPKEGFFLPIGEIKRGYAERQSLDFLVRFVSRQNERRQASIRGAAVENNRTCFINKIRFNS